MLLYQYYDVSSIMDLINSKINSKTMLKHQNILIAYFIFAAALLFKLSIEPRNLLFVAQPAVLVLLYWRKLPQLKAKGLHKIILSVFVLLYGIHLFIQVYDILKYNEQVVGKSIVLNILFVLAVAVAFVSEKQIEEGEASS